MGTTNHFCFEHNQLRNGTNKTKRTKPKQKPTWLITLAQILLCLKHNGVATKAPPITTMTLLATTFFVYKSTSFYKSTLNDKPTLKNQT